MTLEVLCGMLELPDEVTDAVLSYRSVTPEALDKELLEQLKKRESWDEAVAKLRERIGEDASGFYILTELLDVACRTYEEYQKTGIGDTVFTDTMKFCTRFIKEQKRVYGAYAFTWAWWFPRQLSLQEFRIGELEYELVDDGERHIELHIPGDADLRPEPLQNSFVACRSFLGTYFPAWLDADWYCNSWMLSPALEQLLGEDSNILGFQGLFDIQSVDYESMAVLDWVFPGSGRELSALPEQTSLQRNMKKFLLAGGKVGWAKGRFR